MKLTERPAVTVTAMLTVSAAEVAGEASAEYLRHLVFVHARQALLAAFASAS